MELVLNEFLFFSCTLVFLINCDMSVPAGFAITTDDGEIRKHLRQLGEPITLFGEGPADRRNRLKELLSIHGNDVIERKKEEDKEIVRPDKDQTETTWYHEGPESLKIARLWLAYYSLPRAKQRLSKVKLESEIPESTITAKRFTIFNLIVINKKVNKIFVLFLGKKW